MVLDLVVDAAFSAFIFATEGIHSWINPAQRDSDAKLGDKQGDESAPRLDGNEQQASGSGTLVLEVFHLSQNIEADIKKQKTSLYFPLTQSANRQFEIGLVAETREVVGLLNTPSPTLHRCTVIGYTTRHQPTIGDATQTALNICLCQEHVPSSTPFQAKDIAAAAENRKNRGVSYSICPMGGRGTEIRSNCRLRTIPSLQRRVEPEQTLTTTYLLPN